MRKSLHKRKEMFEKHNKTAAWFKDFILGGQDGLVNVLGIMLGIAVGTGNSHIVIIAGLASMFAESVSMGAVAFTSTKAESDYYKSQENLEEYEIENCPKIEKEEIYDIYKKKGFKGKLLSQIVTNITSNKKRWRDIMMEEELGLSNKFNNPIKSAIIVFFSSILGSIIPILPFFFFPIYTALVYSLVFSAIALFITGALEAKFTLGNWIYKGMQLTLIGMAAAAVGFIVGKVTGISS